jgi:hypothetical protein
MDEQTRIRHTAGSTNDYTGVTMILNVSLVHGNSLNIKYRKLEDAGIRVIPPNALIVPPPPPPPPPPASITTTDNAIIVDMTTDTNVVSATATSTSTKDTNDHTIVTIEIPVTKTIRELRDLIGVTLLNMPPDWTTIENQFIKRNIHTTNTVPHTEEDAILAVQFHQWLQDCSYYQQHGSFL